MIIHSRIYILMLSIALMAIGCNSKEKAIQGLWGFEKIERDGVDISHIFNDNILNFHEDGTFKPPYLKSSETLFEGTWKVIDDKLVLSVSGHPLEGEYEISEKLYQGVAEYRILSSENTVITMYRVIN